ncbi:hypothetical protein J3R30DRAFT_3864388 [Lentinula aciculospora]|uniref:Uncharacterized protein n=1 Tax=Lentinula aciculospora TaxID=153920 RepID=A0A9W9AFN6_9AGAR|nr:hypothetical protein J3R30DRAFT_3864388 [Lentinula aciculospora]
MSSYLEIVPHDILEHIAFLVVLTPGPFFSSLQGLLNLMLTSSTLHSSLCTSSAPHLYARIFRNTFDLDTSGSSFNTNQCTDSGLTFDLISRYRLLRRVRRHEFSDEMMLEDLCVAMRTVLESAGVEIHLRSVGFSEFIFSYAQQCLTKHQLAQTNADFDCKTRLVLWLLAFTWSRADITKIAQEIRENFFVLLRSLVLADVRDQTVLEAVYQSGTACIRDCHSSKADCATSILIPSASSAAIILYFALQEAGCTEVAPRLLSGREIDHDFSDEREGLTMEDYCRMTTYRTPLYGDICFTSRTSNPRISSSIRHDRQFFNLKLHGSNAYQYLPEVITGLWEGVYMVSSAHMNKEASFSSTSTPDFICKKFLQCPLVLFFNFGTADSDLLVPESIRSEVSQWSATPRDFSTDTDYLTISGRRTPYEKFVYPTGGKCTVSGNYSQALDCLVVGRTAQDHDSAWGGFNFAGRLKQDGTIVMKREPKNSTDAGLGTWIFEGNVRYGSVFVGSWRSSMSPGSGIYGLFSLGKKASPSQDEP